MGTKEGMKEVGRLALRSEGDFWVAYYALPDTMDGAVLLGSIAMRFVQDKNRKRLFQMLMQEAVADLLEGYYGTRPHWPSPPVAAPEHERQKT